MKKITILSIFIFSTFFAFSQTTTTQSGQKWTTSGNTIDTGDYLGTVNNQDLRFITNDTIRMLLTKEGNVIVNNGFQVNKETNFNGDIKVNGNQEIENNLTVNGNMTINTNSTIQGSQTINKTLTVVDSTMFQNNVSIIGKVGIGKPVATEQLEVNGNIKANNLIVTDLNSGLLSIDRDGKLYTAPVGSVPETPQLKVTDKLNVTGNIVVGTSLLKKELNVNGKINANDIEVSSRSWADYVFKDGYQLMPLSEVELFVEKNNHLPNVPSEKEVLTNGINVAQMNETLLMKIEELTLYIIEQQKMIEQLQLEMNQLKKQ